MINYGISVVRVSKSDRLVIKLRFLFKLILKASKIEGCKFVRQFDLPFDFKNGVCNTFHTPVEQVLMCFSESARKRCDM